MSLSVIVGERYKACNRKFRISAEKNGKHYKLKVSKNDVCE